MTFKLVRAAVVAGLAVFVWGFISWTVLPWHGEGFLKFKDEKAVQHVLKENAPEAGVYILPSPYMHDAEGHLKREKCNECGTGPYLFGSVNPEGMKYHMPSQMVIGLLTQIVAAFLIAWLLSHVKALSYGGRVLFVVVIAFFAGVVCDFPNWIWMGHSLRFTAIMMLDLIIGWFFGGLILAKLAKN